MTHADMIMCSILAVKEDLKVELSPDETTSATDWVDLVEDDTHYPEDVDD